MVIQEIQEEAHDFSASPRWDHPDQPGSANVRELWQRVNSPAKLSAFRETKEGEYLLTVIEAFEESLNDDWLPNQILGMDLQMARQFISAVSKELTQNQINLAIRNLRELYSSLTKA